MFEIVFPSSKNSRKVEIIFGARVVIFMYFCLMSW